MLHLLSLPGATAIRASPLIVIPLFKGLNVTTDGQSESPTVLDLDVAPVRNLLVQCESIFLLGLTDGIAANMIEWNVAFFSGFDRDHQPASPTNIAATNFGLSVVGSQRSVDYTSLQNFNLDSRLRVWWQNKNAVTGAKNATLSAALGARTFGM